MTTYEGLTFDTFVRLSSAVPLSTRLAYQRAVAVRYGPLLLLRAPGFVSALFVLLRPLMPAKIAQRVRFDDDLAAARELVPDARLLPPELRPAGAAGAEAGDDAEARRAPRELMAAWVDEQLRLEAKGL